MDTEENGSRGLIHGELTKAVIGAAMEVHNELGWGFLEKVYRVAMCQELNSVGLSVVSEAKIPVAYKGKTIGVYYADILVEGKVLCEIKVAEILVGGHEAQLLNYLKATGTKVGLLLNFGSRKLQFRRMVN